MTSAFAQLLSNMDYDATDIASTYDRGRDHGPEFLDLWTDVVAAHVRDRRIETILDLGSAPLGLGSNSLSLSHSLRCGLQIYRRLRRLVVADSLEHKVIP